MRATRCRTCGELICFAKTRSGKFMPCDAEERYYRRDPEGAGRAVVIGADGYGAVIRCTFVSGPDESDGLGHVPHWATCTDPGSHRNRDGGR